jgi:hypothetical protein
MSSPRRQNDNKRPSDTTASEKDESADNKKPRLSTITNLNSTSQPISFVPRVLSVSQSALSTSSSSSIEAKVVVNTPTLASSSTLTLNQVDILQIRLSEDCKTLREKFDMIATTSSLIAPLCSVRPQKESNLYAIAYGLIFSYGNYHWIKNGISKRLYKDNIVELGQKYNFTLLGRRNFEETLLKLKPIRNLLADHFYYLISSARRV